jgi:hypothetical protein
MGKHSESTTQFRDVYVEITNRILAAMENAKRWEKPWQPGVGSDGKQLSRPINVTTGKHTVGSTSRSYGRDSLQWMTTPKSGSRMARQFNRHAARDDGSRPAAEGRGAVPRWRVHRCDPASGARLHRARRGQPAVPRAVLRNAEEGESEAVPARDPPWSAVGAAALRSWRRHPPTSPKSRRVRRSRFSGRRSICATLALMG